MLKNYIFLLSILIGSISSLNAQCTPVSNDTPGIYPDSVLTTGCVDAPYLDSFTIVAPYDTTFSGFRVFLDSAEVLEYINVPAGLTFSCGTSCRAYPSGPSTPAKVCTKVSGSSSVRVVNQKVGVRVQVWVNFMGSPVSLFDTLNVYVNIDTLNQTLTVSAPTLTANETGATYQWLDCNNSYAIIGGETGQSYTAASSGNYAVEITKNGCVDTSVCENVSTTAIENILLSDKINIFPNPSNDGHVTIKTTGVKTPFLLEVLDVTGKLVKKEQLNTNLFEFNLGSNKGIYQIKLTDAKGNHATKLLMVQ